MNGNAELWDDSYGYEGNENTTLTQIFPWSVTARVSADYLVKDYARRIFTAVDATVPTGPFRSDTKAVGGIELKKTFEDGFFPELTLSVSYLYQRNMSNDH